VSQLVERMVHGLRVVIDREQCVGFGDCMKEAPEAFVLDDETIAVFTQPETVARERLLRACDSCPVGRHHRVGRNREPNRPRVNPGNEP
jgi:ferredoxin